MLGSTQKQLKLQEETEALSEAIINAVERLKAQGIHCIVNSDFEAVNTILNTLAAVREMVEQG